MSCHLIIHRPSPTTVSFTVSNAPARRTWLAKFAFAVEFLQRAIVFIATLLVNAAKLRNSLLASDSYFPWSKVWGSSIGILASQVADQYGWLIVGSVSTILMFFVLRRNYTEESLLVIRGLGVQTSTSSAMYWSSSATRFIPTTQIQDIIIHEAFKGFQVRFYLAVIVEGETNALVVFPNLLPKRMILEEVWRGARNCLYESKSVPLHG